MALVNCPNCGRSISDKAAKCIHCGFVTGGNIQSASPVSKPSGRVNKRIVCEICESTEFTKKDGDYICDSCGCKYSVDEIKKMISSSSEAVIETSHNEPVYETKAVTNPMFNDYMRMINDAFEDGRFESASIAIDNAIMISPNEPILVFRQALIVLIKEDNASEIPMSVKNGINRSIEYSQSRHNASQMVSFSSDAKRDLTSVVDYLRNKYNQQIRQLKGQLMQERSGWDQLADLGRAQFVVDQYQMQDKKIKQNNDMVNGKIDRLYSYKAQLTDFEKEYSNVINRLYTEAKQKNAEQYWSAHPDERKELDSKLMEINERIDECNRNIDSLQKERIAVPSNAKTKEIHKELSDLTVQRNNMGVTKIKEKRELQNKIDKLNVELGIVNHQADKERNSIDVQIQVVNNRLNSLVSQRDEILRQINRE